MTITSHNPGTHLTGPDRTATAQQAAELYVQGCTIQSVARQIGRSYGLARELLLEAGVTLRARGGGRRRQ
ncbi:helix-turn-helix domain-containing protein [Streptomyces sp. NPDC051987]|uniref:helix-turn-helix domain-containing protein n=1 Tax=Streptomyces sp. NPDC051987 TaxID=3155808 RepID=UPI00343D1BAB